MILNKLEDFTNAILRGEEINHETVFYTGILDDVTENGSDNKSPHPQIGDLYKGGIYIGSYNGKDVVMALKDEEDKYTFDEAMDVLEDKRPLSLLEWLLYLENKEIIDKKLKEHRGEPLKDKYYWSSSEDDYYGAWNVRPSDGFVYGYGKTYSLPVRCVLAF